MNAQCCKSVVWGIAFVVLMVGCAPKAYRKTPRFDEFCGGIVAYGLVAPDVEICEITTGGVREIRDDWCDLGEQNVQEALNAALKARGVPFTNVEIDDNTRAEIEDVRALYRAVSQSIRIHTYGPHAFPEKVKDFDYSVGPIEWIRDKWNCDALVFAYGTDEISTGGRKTLMALGVIAGAFTGTAIVPRSGITAVNVAVVDSSGQILWYGSKASRGGHDLRDPASAFNLIGSLMEDFPKCAR